MGVDLQSDRKVDRATATFEIVLLLRFVGCPRRAIEEGVPETGVSVAFTVLKMDAGPIIAAETKQVDDVVTTADLLPELFAKGTVCAKPRY